MKKRNQEKVDHTQIGFWVHNPGKSRLLLSSTRSLKCSSQLSSLSKTLGLLEAGGAGNQLSISLARPCSRILLPERSKSNFSPEEYLLLATVVLVFKHLCFPRIMLKPSIYLSILMTMTSVVLAANEVKYAPNYCLRFRFNCQSESKRDHVCCLYPLPNGNEAPSRPNNNAMMKFRPIRLPNRKNTEENVSTERPQPINKNPNRYLINRNFYLFTLFENHENCLL